MFRKTVSLDCVSTCLSMLQTTLSAFSKSNKIMMSLKERQKTLKLPDQKLIHDEPTHWNYTFEMIAPDASRLRHINGLKKKKKKLVTMSQLRIYSYSNLGFDM